MAAPGTHFKYWAFLSYSHRDEKWAKWLHRAIETYKGHKRLVGSPNQSGEPVPERLFPVFRDRDELEGVSDLPARIQGALAESRCLIVICSPHSAASHWVNEEIRAFKAIGPKQEVLAFIIDGEPWAGDERECFPQALRFRVGPDGKLTTEREEPGAADARKKKDGRRNALLKILARLLDVELDKLRQRDQERRRRQGFALTTGLAVLTLVLSILAGVAWYQRQVAVQEKERADKARSEAEHQRAVAEERARIALSRQLSSMARNELPSGPGARFDLSRALLLAVQAERTAPLTESYAVLLQALQTAPRRMRFLWGHRGDVNDLTFIPDGRLVSAGQDGRAILWDASTAKPEAELTPGGALYSVAHDAGSGLLALAGQGGEVSLWNPSTRERLGDPLKTGDEFTMSLAFSPDGRTLAAAGTSGHATLWDVSSRSLRSTRLQGLGGSLGSVAFSPDGATLVTAGADGQLMLWDWARGQPRGDPLQGHKVGMTSSVNAVAFNPDGKSLASAGSHGMLLLWNLALQPPKSRRLESNETAVLGVAFSPDGKTLANAGNDGEVILRGQRDGVRLQAHGDAVTDLAFSADGTRLASASRSGRLIVWDMAEHPPLGERWAGNREWASHIVFSPDGKTAVSLGGELILWDTALGKMKVAPRPGWIGAATYSPESQRIAVVDANNQLLLVDLSALSQGAVPLGHRMGTLRALSFSQDGRALFAIDVSGKLRTWDVATRGLLATHDLMAASIRGPFTQMSGAAFSPDAKILAWADGRGRISLWDVGRHAHLTKPIPGHDASLHAIAFGPKGRTLITADNTGQLRIWDLHTQPLSGFTLPRQGSSFSTFAFSPDGATLATATRGGIAGNEWAELWDVAMRRRIGEPILARGGVNRLRFSPDGTILAAGGKDRIHLWDVTSRRPLGELQWEHAGEIVDIAFSSDGERLISAGRHIVAWGLNRRAWIDRACYVANRNLSRGEWADAMGKETPYERVCQGLPEPVSNVEAKDPADRGQSSRAPKRHPGGTSSGTAERK